MQNCTDKNFINFFLGQLLTHLGDSFLQICTVAIMMEQMDKPGSIIAMILFFFLLPSLIFSPIAGIMTDKFSRKNIMLCSTIYRLVVSLVFIFYALFVVKDLLSPIVTYVYSFLVGIGMALFYPAKMATVPNIVKPIDLKPANSLISGSGNLSITAGAIFAGFLIKFTGIANCAYLGLVMYFIAFFLLMLIKVNKDNRGEVKTLDLDLFRFFKLHKKTLYSIFLVVIITLLGATFYSTMNAIATDIFKVDITGLTILKGILGLGSCFGIAFNFMFSKKIKSNKMMSISFLGIALMLLTASHCTNYARAVVWLGTMGFFAIILQITIDAMLQKTTNDKVRGKIFGLKSVVTTTVTLLGTLFVSLGIRVISPMLIVYVIGIGSLMMSFLILNHFRFKKS